VRQSPAVEITEVLICWFSTTLLLAFFAFLFKIASSFHARFLTLRLVRAGWTFISRKVEKYWLQIAWLVPRLADAIRLLVGDRAEMPR